MYELWGGGAPFTVVADGKKQLRDRAGTAVRLLGISGDILHKLKYDHPFSGLTKIAWVSCTDEPAWAKECLQKFKSSGDESIGGLVDNVQIFKDNKQTRKSLLFIYLSIKTSVILNPFTDFHNLKKAYPDIEYEDMLFFDNEIGNIRSVSKLGVCCVHCPEGVTQEIWIEGLNLFKKGKERTEL